MRYRTRRHRYRTRLRDSPICTMRSSRTVGHASCSRRMDCPPYWPISRPRSWLAWAVWRQPVRPSLHSSAAGNRPIRARRICTSRCSRCAMAATPPRAATGSRMSGVPFDLSLWLLWGNALAGCGRSSEAEGCYNTCVQQWSDSYGGWWYRGLCRLESQKYREAEADFQQVLQRQPDFLPALINRWLARREQGQLADATADLTMRCMLPRHADAAVFPAQPAATTSGRSGGCRRRLAAGTGIGADG